MSASPDMPTGSAAMLNYYQKTDALIAARLDDLRSLKIAKNDDVALQIRFLAGNDSLATLGGVHLDASRLTENFREIVELLVATAPENPLGQVLSAHPGAKGFVSEDWQGSLRQIEQRFSNEAENIGVDADSLLQLVTWAISPFFRLAADIYAQELNTMVTNERGLCPICGKHADFAILDDSEHGRRYLSCTTCLVQWQFKRMGCSYCGNTEHNRLGYLLVDEFKGYKIYCCEECRSYLKTFDQRCASSRMDSKPMLDDIKTLGLDMLALKKGYLPMHGH
jgi:FdhE protein